MPIDDDEYIDEDLPLDEKVMAKATSLQKQRWQEHAASRGISLAKLIRLALDRQVALAHGDVPDLDDITSEELQEAIRIFQQELERRAFSEQVQPLEHLSLAQLRVKVPDTPFDEPMRIRLLDVAPPVDRWVCRICLGLKTWSFSYILATPEENTYASVEETLAHMAAEHGAG